MLRAWAPDALQEVLEEIEFARQRQVHVANPDEEEGFYGFEEAGVVADIASAEEER